MPLPMVVRPFGSSYPPHASMCHRAAVLILARSADTQHRSCLSVGLTLDGFGDLQNLPKWRPSEGFRWKNGATGEARDANHAWNTRPANDSKYKLNDQEKDAVHVHLLTFRASMVCIPSA